MLKIYNYLSNKQEYKNVNKIKFLIFKFWLYPEMHVARSEAYDASSEMRNLSINDR